MKYYILLFVSLTLVLAGCSAQTLVKYQCVDGSFVDSANSCSSKTCPEANCPRLDCASCPIKTETKIETKTVEKTLYVCPDTKTVVSNVVDCKKEFYGNVTYKFTDEIIAGDFMWTFLTNKQQKSFASGNIFQSSYVADGTYLIIQVEVENVGKQAEHFDNSLMKLLDIKDREFISDDSATAAYNGQSFALFSGFGDTINPGIIKKGYVVFDIPENLEDLKIVVTSNKEKSNLFNIKLS